MAISTRTIKLARSTRLAREGSSNTGAGRSERLPVGYLTSAGRRQRAYLRLKDNRFPSAHWAGMVSVERVELWGYRVGDSLVDNGGATPQMRIRRATAGETEGTSSTLDASNGGGSVWPGPATASGTEVRTSALGTDDGRGWTLIADVTRLVRPAFPTALGGDDEVMFGLVWAHDDDDWTSTPSYTAAGDNTEWASDDYGDGSKAPYLLFRFDDDQPPTAPGVISPEPGGDPTQVATVSGHHLTVTFDFNDPDDAICSRAELEVFPNAITDDTADTTTPTVTTGAIAPTSTGVARRYRVSIAGLPTRTDQRYRIRARDPDGKWGPYTSLADGRIQTAFRPGAPLASLMQTDPTAPHIYGTLDSPDPDDYLTGWQGQFYKDNTDGTITTLWAPSVVDIGGTSTRSDITWGGVALKGGDKVRWRHRHTNRDEVVGAWSDWITTTMISTTGPTITPADTGTKLGSRTDDITISASSFDGYHWRLYRGATKIYDSGPLTIAAATSKVVSPPAGVLDWGDIVEIEAAVRPAGTATFGDFSPKSWLRVNALPSTVVTAGDGDVEDATVVGTSDVLWSAPFTDADKVTYGDTPVGKELMLLVSPAGTTVERRVSLTQIVEDERTGRQLMALTDATGWVPAADVTATATATAPTGYSGNSTDIQGTGGSAADRGARYTFATPLDLSEFGGGALFRIHRRITSVTNLTKAVMRFEFATTSDYAQFEIVASGAATSTWAEVTVAKGNPLSTAGTVDWSNVVSLLLLLDVSAAFTGNLQVRDLRIGTTQTAKDTPDGYFAAEATAKARVRYLDDADPWVSTTLAASAAAAATNVKVASVASLYVGAQLTLVTAGANEVRTISAVGTAGAGGTGVDIDALTFAHGSGDTVRIDSWGAWSDFTAVKASRPPVVAASTPAHKALVADPTVSFIHTFTSPGGKLQALRSTRLYRRLGQIYRSVASGAVSLWRLSEPSGTFADTIPATTHPFVAYIASRAVSYWRMTETTGSTNGTVVDDYQDVMNGALATMTTGTLGAAGLLDNDLGSRSFDTPGGAADCVAVNNTASHDFLSGTTPWTIGGIVDLDAYVASARGLFFYTAGTGSISFYMGTGGSTIRIDRTDGAGTDSAGVSSSGATGKHWWVATYDGSNLRLYRDGALVAGPTASTRSISATSKVIRISGAGGVSSVDGRVSEVFIDNVAWSAAEITAANALRFTGTTSGFAGTASGTMTREATGALSPVDLNAAVGLGGTDGAISLGDIYDFAGTTAFSVGLWIRPDAAAASRILSKEHASLGGWRLAYGADTSVRFARIDSTMTADETAATVTVAVGTKARVVVTYDAATIKLYVDGELAAEVASTRSLAGHSGALYIGRYSAAASNYFSGLVDELTVWDRAITATEVANDWIAAEEPKGDQLVWESDVADALLTDTLPALLLTDGNAYAWEKTAYDTDALYDTTDRRSFSTSFSTPAAITNLAGTADDENSAITLTWTASTDPYLDHYRVWWRDQAGQFVRIDGGPEAVEDGREKLTTATFTYYGGRLGVNVFLVTAHNGALESEPATVEVTLGSPTGSMWMFAADGEERYTFGFNPDRAPRTHSGTVETFRPPGRPHPVHLHWGKTGRSVSLTLTFLPSKDGDLLTPLAELHDSGMAEWIKAPSTYQWDVMRCRIVGLSDEVQPNGFVSVSLDLDEVSRDDV